MSHQSNYCCSHFPRLPCLFFILVSPSPPSALSHLLSLFIFASVCLRAIVVVILSLDFPRSFLYFLRHRAVGVSYYNTSRSQEYCSFGSFSSILSLLFVSSSFLFLCCFSFSSEQLLSSYFNIVRRMLLILSRKPSCSSWSIIVKVSR